MKVFSFEKTVLAKYVILLNFSSEQNFFCIIPIAES